MCPGADQAVPDPASSRWWPFACQPASLTHAIAFRVHGPNTRSDREVNFTIVGIVAHAGEEDSSGQPEVHGVS